MAIRYNIRTTNCVHQSLFICLPPIRFPLRSKYILFLWMTIKKLFHCFNDKQPQNFFFCTKRQPFCQERTRSGRKQQRLCKYLIRNINTSSVTVVHWSSNGIASFRSGSRVWWVCVCARPCFSPFHSIRRNTFKRVATKCKVHQKLLHVYNWHELIYLSPITENFWSRDFFFRHRVQLELILPFEWIADIEKSVFGPKHLINAGKSIPIKRMVSFNCGRGGTKRKINFTINFYFVANDSINKWMTVRSFVRSFPINFLALRNPAVYISPFTSRKTAPL